MSLTQPDTDSSASEHKSSSAFRTIGEVAAELGLPTHVLRFWETKFPQIRPHKRRGGHRYYRPQDAETIREIKELLHSKGFTIKGAQKYLSLHKKEKTAQDQAALFAPASLPPTAPKTAAQPAADTSQIVLKQVFNELCEIRELLGQN